MASVDSETPITVQSNSSHLDGLRAEWPWRLGYFLTLAVLSVSAIWHINGAGSWWRTLEKKERKCFNNVYGINLTRKESVTREFLIVCASGFVLYLLVPEE